MSQKPIIDFLLNFPRLNVPAPINPRNLLASNKGS